LIAANLSIPDAYRIHSNKKCHKHPKFHYLKLSYLNSTEGVKVSRSIPHKHVMKMVAELKENGFYIAFSGVNCYRYQN